MLLAPAVILVGWARVEVGDHTPAQAGAGAVVGIAIAGTIFYCAEVEGKIAVAQRLSWILSQIAR